MIILSYNCLLLELAILTALITGCFGNLECMLTHSGKEYQGTVSTTVNGHTCQRWDSQTPQGHIYTNPASYPETNVSDAANYCRNPDRMWGRGTWCFTVTPGKRWDVCVIPYCECKSDVIGYKFVGSINTTSSGLACQSWDNLSPHPHNFTNDEDFYDHDLLDAGNHCRNPRSSRPLGPWCYTIDPTVEWEYCEIALCDISSEEETTIGTVLTVTTAKAESGKEDEGEKKDGKDNNSPKTGASTDEKAGMIGPGGIAGIVLSLMALIAGTVIGLWWRFYRQNPELPSDKMKFENFDNPLYNKPASTSKPSTNP